MTTHVPTRTMGEECNDISMGGAGLALLSAADTCAAAAAAAAVFVPDMDVPVSEGAGGHAGAGANPSMVRISFCWS